MNCEHKYVNMEDGTMDKFCVRCSKKAKQGLLQIDPRANQEVEINKEATSGPISEIKINTNISIRVDPEELVERIHRRLIETANRRHYGL